MAVNYTKQELMSLGVYDLRNLARQFGVKSPTSLTKEEIADKCLAIFKGEAIPVTTKFGRPHKTQNGLAKGFGLMEGMEDKFKIEPMEFYRRYSGVVREEVYNFKETNNPVLATGYVKFIDDYSALIMNKGYCSDRYEENILIVNEVLNSYALKDGDFVECAAVNIGPERPLIAKEITTINNIPADQVSKERVDFKQMNSLYPYRAILFNDTSNQLSNFKVHETLLPLGFGSRTLVTYPRGYDRITTIYKYANEFTDSNNIQTIVVAIGESPEDLYELQSHLTNATIIQDDLPENNVLELLETKICNLLRNVEMGNDTAIIITNFLLLKSYIASVIYKANQNKAEINANIDKKLLALMNLAKQTDTEGSCTVMAFSALNVDDERQYLPMSTINGHIVYKNNCYINTNISIDLFKSDIYRKDKLLSGSGLIKHRNFYENLIEAEVSNRLKNII